MYIKILTVVSFFFFNPQDKKCDAEKREEKEKEMQHLQTENKMAKTRKYMLKIHLEKMKMSKMVPVNVIAVLLGTCET